jgi:hypothetical protein
MINLRKTEPSDVKDSQKNRRQRLIRYKSIILCILIRDTHGVRQLTLLRSSGYKLKTFSAEAMTEVVPATLPNATEVERDAENSFVSHVTQKCPT